MMMTRMACVVLVALAASGCDHPLAHRTIVGPSPEPSAAQLTAWSADAEQAAHAGAVLKAMLGAHGLAPAGGGALPLPAGPADRASSVPAAWLEAQSATFRDLAARSHAAWIAASGDAQE
jgi:type IV secretory pathway TrbL component